MFTRLVKYLAAGTAKHRTPPSDDGAAALIEAGIRAWRGGDAAEGERLLREAVARAPGVATYNPLGVRLAASGRLDEALELFERAVAIDSSQAISHLNVGNAQRMKGRSALALDAYRRALAIDPDQPAIWANVFRPLLDAFDWASADRGVEVLLARRAARDRNWARHVLPMDSLLLPFDQEARREVAEYHAAALAKAAGAAAPLPPRPERARLRIGYLSRDYRHHAVGELARALFRYHDRDRFEAVAYSYGRDDGSRYRAEIISLADRFVDLHDRPHAEALAAVRADAPDILVDLGGYTTQHRLAILAARSAPIQLHYLGYPATLGGRLADYYLGDAIASPPGQERHYAEQLVRLPGCFMLSDIDQPIVSQAPSRAALGLPDDAIVFCAFHQSAKVTQAVFRAWLTILTAVPGSVLWLKKVVPEGAIRLAEAARAAGVDPARIQFADNVRNKAAHVGRMAAADLFLDSFGRYNGHSTVNEALWAGLPVVTLAGDAFASRVAASLLTAAGTPELAARSTADYIETAISVARDPARRELLRSRLFARPATAPLFDTARTVRALEQAYARMWSMRQAGEAPRAFTVGDDA